MALSLLSQATNGTAFDEIRNGLHFNGDKTALAVQINEYYGLIQKSAGPSDLIISNQIYVNQEHQLVTEFQELAENKFLSGVKSVVFKKPIDTAEAINNFFKEKTKENIKDIVKPEMFNTNSSVILVNAIFFKSKWAQPFERESIGNQKFYINETHTIDAESMQTKQKFRFASLDDLDADILRLDYAYSNLSFVIILPKSRIGLSALEEKLNNHSLTSIIDRITSYRIIRIGIPRFKIESEIRLSELFKKVCD